MNQKKIVLVAGGTAGHINPAISLGDFLEKKSYKVFYITGTRELDFKLFKEKNAKYLPAKAFSKSPLKLLVSIFKNLYTFFYSLFYFLKNRPVAVIGAGGYICGPVGLAAYLLLIPLFVLEQNAVLGITNKILAKLSKKIFLNFKNTKGIQNSDKTVVVGNPIRFSDKDFKAAPLISDENFNILVFGGSLGAKDINDFIRGFSTSYKGKKIKIIAQTGSSYTGPTEPIENEHVSLNHLKYLDNIIEFYNWSNLILCRAGASSISELRLAKRPVILVPYPISANDHQTYNAKSFQGEVTFSVYVHKLEELKMNNFQLMNSIINNVRTNSGPKEIDTVVYQDPCLRIYDEISTCLETRKK